MPKKMKFTFEDEEKIVEYVKTNEVLFNVRHKSFRDAELKNRLWLQLANKLHVEMPIIKKKWKSMRDYYVNSKAKKTTGSAATSTKRDEALSFLDDTSMLKRATTSNMDTEEVPNTLSTPTSEFEEQEFESMFSDSLSLPYSPECCYVENPPDSTPRSSTSVAKKRKLNRSQDETNDILRELISSRPKPIDFNPPQPQKQNKASTFFASMAETVEKFSDVAIARTKMKIAQIVLEEEVKWAEEQERLQQQQNSQNTYLVPEHIPMPSTSSSSSAEEGSHKEPKR